MSQLLRPMPMTAAQIADLVERTRAAQTGAARSGNLASRVPMHDRSVTRRLRARCAARFRALTGCTMREAARAFVVSETLAYAAYRVVRGLEP